MTTEVVRIVEELMDRDDETTGKELQMLLSTNDITVPQMADRARLDL